MNENIPTAEKNANLLIALFFLGLGVLFILFHFALLPILGLFLGIGCLIIGGVFLLKHNKHLPRRKDQSAS